ncbi:MAG TPA: hypothetical protein VMY42_01485 [Thermoguttaceae bacterium]|nr:hypothetical protein [Thermoguttaceae bacterium]
MSASVVTPADPELSADALVLLDQADSLLPDFPIASGMMARASLEAHLRQLCHRHDCEPPFKELRFSVRDACLTRLRKAGAINKAIEKEASRLFLLGSKIIHCEVCDQAAIEGLVQDVRRFVESFDGNGGGL